MKRWTEPDALDILAARAFEDERWRTHAFMLRMAEISLFRKKSLCVRWRKPLRRHGDRRYKAALRVVRAAWEREIQNVPRGATLLGVRFE